MVSAVTTFVFFLIVSVFVIVYRNKRRYQVPPTNTVRTDLRYGYYLTEGSQAEETSDHVNLWWLRLSKAQEVLADYPRPAVLDVSEALFESYGRLDHRLRSDAAPRLVALLMDLKISGALSWVYAITPIDEPNLTIQGDRAAILNEALDIIEHACRVVEFQTTHAVVYGGVKNGWPCIERFKFVGLDEYGKGTDVLKPGGRFDKLREAAPHAKFWLFPGGSYGEPIQPWVYYANAHEDVDAIIPFLWIDAEDGELIQGIGSGPMREQYVAAGRKISNAY